MVLAKRSSMIEAQIAALQRAKGKKVEAGWFDTDRYPAKGNESVGISVAAIARLNEFGGTITHPGGTGFITDAAVKKGNVISMKGTRFVSSKFTGQTDGTTGAHSISIPARPFMRLAWSMFRQNESAMTKKLAGKLVRGQLTVTQMLGQIGNELENQIVKSIKTGPWVRNAPSTIALKGFDKPLIDTAHMWQSVNSKVS